MQCHLYFHPSIHLSSIFQFIYHTQSIYFFWHLSKQIVHRERDVSFPGLFPPCSTKNSLQLTESVSISQHFDFPNCSNALPWSALINAVWSITSGSASVSNRLRSNGTRSFHRKKKEKKFVPPVESNANICTSYLIIIGGTLCIWSTGVGRRDRQTGASFRPKCWSKHLLQLRPRCTDKALLFF